ncbi:MAG: S-layer homology domain-containing protein [Clostridia bacterium]|nr:S-layer homology domain-containing protein [Clostridia bacterium]
MNKKRSLLLMLVTVLILVLAISLPAMAATQYTTITLNDVQYGDKGSLDDLSMLDSTKKTKVIIIEKNAADYMIKNNQNMTMNLGDWVITFSPSIFQCDAIAKAVATREPVSYKLTFETAPSTSISTYFSEISQAAKGNYRLNDGEFTLEAEILTAGTNYYTLENLASPIKITYEYEWTISDYNAKEAKLTYAWLDLDAAKKGKKVEWQTMSGAVVDTEKDTFKVGLTKGTGYYLPVASTYGMGANSTDDGSNTPTDTYVPIPTGHWAASDIANMQNNLVVPYSLAGINLSEPITRGEFASYIVNVLRLTPNTTAAGKFSDVSTSNKYYTAIYTGVANGILKGVTETTFAPTAKISRQEMAVMFQRALLYKAVTVNKDTAKLNAFNDGAKVSSWATEGAAVAVNAGLILGQNGNYFAPKANATWAEAVVMLNRLYEQLY